MSAPQRRGMVVRDFYFRRDPSKPHDPAELEAERLHLSDLSGFDIRFLYFDKMYLESPQWCHKRFLDEIDAQRPEFIFFHPLLFYDLMHMNMRPEILFAARQIFGPRLVFSFGDAAYTPLVPYLAGYAALGDVSVTWDGNGSRLSAMLPGKPVLDLWTPVDTRFFRDLGLERQIDVCFAGSVNFYEDRKKAIREAQELGVPVVVRGGDRDTYVPTEDYVRLLCESKISLNFSKTTEGEHQLKGRVLESIICGALLFESENSVTARYLQPYRHYVPFRDVADLAAKVRRYLGNEPARKAIVAAAQAHVAANLSERVWWRRIVSEVDRSWAEEIRRRGQAQAGASDAADLRREAGET